MGLYLITFQVATLQISGYNQFGREPVLEFFIKNGNRDSPDFLYLYEVVAT